MFGTLLIANRGEIAIRVIRSARELGLRTVAVYSDADREAPHVRLADTAVRIGPTPAAESYLSIEAILAAARETGADAIHPGYGFLSERAAFAQAVTDAGLVFVGPSAAVMEQMGRKDHAREIAMAAGVPVVPSWSLDEALADPERLDYPVLVKAAAGGGGKGMHVARTPAELRSSVETARREAGAAFGDDTLLLERYVERGRHVEVQVLGDAHGTVVHLFERDCSSQRRHQKVIEEAPAPTITAAQRALLTESAVALARQVGYVNAGTVEFLVEDAPGSDAAYFLEMNTRLQVEHPVTESVVTVRGEPLDLVALQLRVAAGEPLGFAQDDVAVEGHAMEARIYAEDAFGGFLPQAGVAEIVRWSARARNDVALESGQAVTSAYDPMIGKVIVRGPDREVARKRLVDALDDTVVLGLTTNTGFLRELAASQEFADAAVDTAWLDRNPDALAPPPPGDAAVFAVWAIADAEIGQRPGDPFGTADGWRSAGPSAPASIPLLVDPSGRQAQGDGAGSGQREVSRWTVSWSRVSGPDRDVSVRLVSRGDGLLRLEIDGVIREAAVRVRSRSVDVVHRGATFTFERPDVFGTGQAGASSDDVAAPMPGTVLDVSVAEDDQVCEGDVLGVLEAMKMELSLRAPHDGVVTRVAATVGEQVALGAVLFVVEPAPVAEAATGMERQVDDA
ncbi:acetyl/propionyl/methylcrotonyl-CoA carboxylase subunit alpha [Nocardioides terrisoli]|uniref:acetyl/propionyl/methylcrotonyl-CoA carboxylase subunit alpha n=1 Tax=Nocardioides terrisoli TaxID=3388267 RepID=UPI00287B85A1|nr:biotin carboxylase N-terminal domain-containing protein [Nocardioides marmorisolisilvae]